MASFHHQSYTFTSGTATKTVYLKWLAVNHRDIRIVYTGWKNVYNPEGRSLLNETKHHFAAAFSLHALPVCILFRA